MPVAQRLGCGRTQCDPLLFAEALPKIHTVGLSIPPAKNTYAGSPSLPYRTTPLTLRSPKPNYWQLTPKGPTWGCAFCFPPFWAHGQVTPNPKKFKWCNFGNPHFGPIGVTCPFLQFWTPEHQRTTTGFCHACSNGCRLDGPKLNSFFSFISLWGMWRLGSVHLYH